MNNFDTFYRTHREKLFGYLLRRTGNYELSKDIMQESFTRLLEHYGPDQQKPSLLFTIARNAILDHLRKSRRNEPLEEGQNKPSSIDPEHRLLIRESYRQVLAAMKQLEETERDILALVVASKLSYREIAQITGTNEVNVKVKVHRARIKLKKILQGDKEQ
jgi:RNA polymerase sigma-70 factor (ECF subfamily)